MGYNNTFLVGRLSKFSSSSINKKSPAEVNGMELPVTLQIFGCTSNYSDKGGPVNTTLECRLVNRLGKDKKLGFRSFREANQNIFRGTTSNFFLPNSQTGLK